MFRHANPVKAALPALAMLWAACDLSVTNPGPLPDSELNTPEAMPGLVVGMSADLSVALGDQVYFSALLADEMAHSGNYNNERYFYQGEPGPEHTNGVWANMQRARWVAESGIERMRDVLGDEFETSELVARAYALAGFANRLAGENVCEAVIDGGARQPHTVHFERALEQFTEAIERAEALGDAALATAARGGRASVRAWLGDWDGAVQDAAQVPADFRYDAIYSGNTTRENNYIVYETHTRREITVYGTPWAEVFGDPRVPWDTVWTSGGDVQTGQDGETPFFRQRKYTAPGDDIALVKGTEMLLLRAEAALRGGDVGTAMSLINDARAEYGLPPLTAANEAEAWAILQRERGADLWLEARRIWDLRRWYAEGRIGKWKSTENQVMCVPVSQNEEMSNPNV
ncbi:MAG TPA: RagB/SusD family nutrient uptake outer membrane protein [Longimicrobiales bacterium]